MEVKINSRPMERAPINMKGIYKNLDILASNILSKYIAEYLISINTSGGIMHIKTAC
jgi:hypothetical protein